MADMLTRGERNRNPFNINYLKVDAWDGQIGIEIVPPGYHFTPRFGLYSSDLLGIRAGMKQLILDNTKHGLKTLRTLIGKSPWGWAPGSDGNYPVNYAELVASFMPGFTIDSPIDFTRIGQLIPASKGFITEENTRCPYDDVLITAACRDALGLSAMPISPL